MMKCLFFLLGSMLFPGFAIAGGFGANAFTFDQPGSSRGAGEGAFGSEAKSYYGSRFEINYRFGERDKFLVGAAYVSQHAGLFDCRTPACFHYESEIKYPAIVGGFDWNLIASLHLWTVLSLGYGTFSFREHDDAADISSQNVFVVDFELRGAYGVEFGSVVIPLFAGIGLLRQISSAVSYRGRDFSDSNATRAINQYPYLIFGMGVEY